MYRYLDLVQEGLGKKINGFVERTSTSLLISALIVVSGPYPRDPTNPRKRFRRKLVKNRVL